MPKLTKAKDGTFEIKRRQIFDFTNKKAVKNGLTEKWFDEKAGPHFSEQCQHKCRPVVHIGHTTKDDKSERPRVAYLDNFQREGNLLFADLVKIPPDAAKIFKDDSFPNGSVEVHADKRGFKSLALLSSTTPAIPTAQLSWEEPTHFSEEESGDDDPIVISFEGEAEMSLEEVVTETETERKLSDVEWAYQKKVWDIQDNQEMTAEQKRTALVEAANEYIDMIVPIQQSQVSETGTESDPPPAADVQMSEAEKQRDIQFREREADLVRRETDLVVSRLNDFHFAEKVVQNYQNLRNALCSGSETIKFSEKGEEKDVPVINALDSFMTDIGRRSREGKLIVPLDPTVTGIHHEQFSETDDSDEAKENRAIIKFQEDYKKEHGKSINYAAARRQYLQMKNTETPISV